MKIQIKKIMLAIIAVIVAANLSAQQNFILNSTSEFKVEGTSTLHDWEMVTSSSNGKAVITLENQQVKSISNLQVTFRAESLKSGKSGLDNNAYKALNTKAHPNITFNLREIRNIKQQGNTLTYTALGELNVAGERRLVTITGNGRVAGDKIHFDGKSAFKMTDFKIDPPTAMMGAVRSGDDVTIAFNVVFQQSK